MSSIQPSPDASVRTKNRLREHANLTPLRTGRVSFFAGPATLFGCNDRGCGWTGWLPENELDTGSSHAVGS